MSHKLELDDFFNNSLKLNISNNFKNAILEDTRKKKENSEEYLKTNILYITTDCNIACDYCYQKEDRTNNPKRVLTKAEITQYFNHLVEREPHNTSTVVLFGGELFTEPDIVFYAISEAERIKKVHNKDVALCVTTNGIWFKTDKNRDKWIKTVIESDVHISTEISYDGSGHDRRVYKNGKSTKKDVQNVLKAFRDAKFPISIRYTIHKDNYLNVIQDFIKICNFYEKFEIPKIIPSTNDTELDEYMNNDVPGYMEQLKPKLNAIYNHYKFPICGYTCEACKLCNFEAFDNINYTVPGLDDFVVDHGDQGNFNHFEKDKNENS